MEEKIENDTSIQMIVLMTPDMVNFSGKVHGGAILKLLDQVAYVCASRYAGNYVVTLSVDQVFFRHPIHVGELVSFFANINYTGKSSMEVGIKVISEDTKTRATNHVLSSYFTMVAVDEHSKSVSIPELKVTTEKQKERREAALKRKLLREQIWKK
ncbi:acyl-CoA thioesterase [Silvanigrella paludirubra]|uniref:Acyl-CoA thioesterase n=1 Tax=Silvanigrella paludirubra TaxID=2499159 RepID=A0A6N6VRW4_9BACT|nr:acyl-CoA thioesterase [Silvanigrella paludirubra]KAB8038690.1 acyl-CoA thioesterase [Silvanigrella paludirubra]